MELKQWLDHRYATPILWLVLFLMYSGVIISSTSHPLGDFGNYYFGSQFLLNGQWGSWIYEPTLFNQGILNSGFYGLFLNYTPVPPITALLYVPFLILDPFTAKMIFNLIGLLAIFISVYRLFNHLGIQKRWALLVLAVAFFPIKSNLDQGQSYLFIAAVLLEGYLAMSRKQHWLAAVLWGIAILLKVFPAVLLLYLIFERNYKQLGRVAVVCLVFIAVSFPFLGFSVWNDYLFEILPRLLVGEINDPFSQSYQSFTVLCRKIFIYDALLNAQPWINSVIAFKILDYAFKFSVVYLVWKVLQKTTDPFGRFATLLATAMLVTGYGTTYSLMLIMPLLVFTFRMFERGKWIFLLLHLMVFSVPVSWFIEFPLLLQFPRLYLLLLLMSFLIYFTQLQLRLKHMALLAVLAIVLGWITAPQPQVGTWVDTKTTNLLSVDFEIENGRISIINYTENGLNEHVVSAPNDLKTVKYLRLEHNQIFYGAEQVTNTNDRKKGPVLASDQHVYYLSDLGRGVGFYALRKLPLTPNTEHEK